MTVTKLLAALAVCASAITLSNELRAQVSGEVEAKAEVKADASMTSGPGESCRARSDCAEGLKCVEQVCRDELEGANCNSRGDCGGRGLSCVDSKCVAPASQGAGSESGGSGESGGKGRRGGDGGRDGGDDDGGGDSGGNGGGGDLLEGELEGLRAHMGIIFGGGPTHDDDASGEAIGSLLFALKGGVFIDRIELGLEFAPATFVLSFDPDLPSVHLNAYGGYHIPVYKSISWPLRAGIGFTTPTFRGDAGQTVLAVRADLIGVSVLLADQFLLDVYLPSWRVNIDPESNTALFTYIFGIGGAWAPKI